MDSLSDRLKSLGFKPAAAVPQPSVPVKQTLEHAIDGYEVINSAGAFVKKEQLFPFNYQHGIVKLVDNIATKTIHQSAKIDYSPGDLDRMLFIDTETSGLSGGAGTFAFLIGIGRFVKEGFLLEQLIIRDPSEELAMLLHLLEQVKPDTIFVSFNGKSFDIPLIQNRLVLNRLPGKIRDLPHVDILHISRKLWRRTLASCTLKELETSILGFNRTSEDVPGWMIPDIYFEYLRNRDPGKLSDVIYHNAQDIVSLAALMIHISRLLEHDHYDLEISTNDLISISRVYWDMGYYDIASKILQSSRTRKLNTEQLKTSNSLLGLYYKKMGNNQEAVQYWEIAAANGDPNASVELAKFYEHQKRDVSAAMFWCEKCSELLDNDPKSVLTGNLRKELEKRILRLKMKERNNV